MPGLTQNCLHFGFVAVGHLAEEVVGVFLAREAYLLVDIVLDVGIAAEVLLPEGLVEGAALPEEAEHLIGVAAAPGGGIPPTTGRSSHAPVPSCPLRRFQSG